MSISGYTLRLSVAVCLLVALLVSGVVSADDDDTGRKDDDAYARDTFEADLDGDDDDDQPDGGDPDGITVAIASDDDNGDSGDDASDDFVEEPDDDSDDFVEVPVDENNDSDDDFVPAPVAPAPVIVDDSPDFDDVDSPSDDFVVIVDDSDDDSDDPDDGNSDAPVDDQAIVQLRAGVSPASFAARHNLTVLRVIPTPNIVLLGLSPTLDDQQELQGLLADADVVWGELNYSNEAPEGRPRYFFTSGAGTPQLVDGLALPVGLEFTPALACSTGDSIVVAVLDTGLDTTHPDLVASLLPNGVNMVDVTFDVRDIGNGIDDDNDGAIDEMAGHGTHVAGVVLQVAPDVQILPVKVLNSDGVGEAFSVTAGIYYAIEQGANVINLSLGSTFPSQAIQEAVDFAISQDIVVVAAAGNLDREEPVEYPAASEGAISVAATSSIADKATYSNFHVSVDISAPGNNVSSTHPGGLYSSASGTSFATPLVAASVALLLEQQPDLEPEGVRFLLQSGSGPLSLSNPALAGKLGAGELDIDNGISCSL